MKSYVADFTPEQLQNASAGRRYGQLKRAIQMERLRQLERMLARALKELSWHQWRMR